MASEAKSLANHWFEQDEADRDYGHPIPDEEMYPKGGEDERPRLGTYVPAAVLEVEEAA